MTVIRAALAILAAIALSACVTMPPQPETDTVTTWRGWNVAGTIPALELAAASNTAQREGRVGFRYVDPGTVAVNCRTRPQEVQGCTRQNGRSYVVYVDAGLPDWMQQLVATHESGHVGQFELGLPMVETGFGDPTISLIRRLGG